MKRRRSVLGLVGIAAAAAAGVPIYAAAGPFPNADAPDLRADPPERVLQPGFYSIGGIGTGRLLVRFDGFVTNIGDGPLEVSGNPQLSQTSTSGVRQRARTAASGAGVLLGQSHAIVGSPPVEYEEADGHDHFHLMRVMRYSLWNSTKTGEASPGQKAGFCLYDIEGGPAEVQGASRYDPQVYTGAVTQFCDEKNAGATSLVMGTSAGWRDVYNRDLAYQWVDVSDTPPGEYYVAAEADPDNIVWEGGASGESNGRAFSPTKVTVPGWLAQPVAVSQSGQQQVIGLATIKFGNPSDSLRRFRIIDPPDHGTLSVGSTEFSTPSVIYTPSPGYTGPDSFSYVAMQDPDIWAYPYNPPQAAVTLTATTPSVAISGAPTSLVAGTSAQLSVATSNVADPVKWSVNGVVGGNTTAGIVSDSGLYTAPEVPPPGGSVTIGATAGPAAAETTIQILPKPKSIPLPGISGRISAGSKLLSPLKVRTVNRRFVVAKVATGRKGGRVAITVSFKRRVLGRCVARVPARRAFTCRVKMPRPYPLKKVRVTAKLKAGKATAVRRSFARK